MVIYISENKWELSSNGLALTLCWIFAKTSDDWCLCIILTSLKVIKQGKILFNMFYSFPSALTRGLTRQHVLSTVVTVGCHYSVGQYIILLNTLTESLRPNINQSLKTQKTPHISPVWTLKRHPIARPTGQAMGCLLWGFWRKLAAL